MKKPLVVSLVLIAGASLAANALLYMRYSTSRPLMRVGSEVISKRDYLYSMDAQYGKSVLNKMAYEKLIRQAAAKAGLTPSSQEVEARLAEIERRTPAMLEEAKRNPWRMDELKRAVATDLAFENLRIQNVKVSGAEAAAFYSRNKALFAVPSQAHTTLVVTQNKVDASTAAELLRRNTKPDVIARQPRLRVVGVNGFNPDWRTLPAEARNTLSSAVFKRKPGEVATVAVGPYFMVLRVTRQSGAGTPPLDKVRDRVMRLVKLQKAPAPDVALARLYKDGQVSFEVDKYAVYFADIEELARKKGDKTASAR